MVDQLSPLGSAYRPGRHGNMAGAPGVALTEIEPGSIVQLAAWPGEEKAVIAAIREISRLDLPDGAGGGVARDGKAAFGIAPGRFLVVDEADGLFARYAAAILAGTGSVTDLSHGRTAIRIAGARAEWVLAKFFAIDFSPAAFPLGAGRSTVHHDVFAQIQRSRPDAFDLYVFRSFARSFWTALCHGAEEVGYEVM